VRPRHKKRIREPCSRFPVEAPVHRDLKPENLFLHRRDDQRLIVKLLDFGVARMADSAGLSKAEARMTRDGAILGTPLFLTPEQALGEVEKIGPATDVWPMGLIAYELLTGVAYWDEEQWSTLLAKIIFKPMIAPSAKGAALGPKFDAWFLRSCAREPEQRWPTVGAQIEALCDALAVDRSILSQLEAPAPLRAWLDDRQARTRSARREPLSLTSIQETVKAKRNAAPGQPPSTAAGDAATQDESSEVVIVESAPPSRRRRLMAAAAALLAASLGLLGFWHLRPRPGGPAGHAALTEVAHPPAAAALPAAPAAPSPPPAVAPSVPDPPEPPPGPPLTHAGKSGSTHPHGKKHHKPRSPTDYDPAAP
jgi:serine/threonine protein kinase